MCALASVLDVSTAEYQGLVFPLPFFLSFLFLLLLPFIQTRVIITRSFGKFTQLPEE